MLKMEDKKIANSKGKGGEPTSFQKSVILDCVLWRA